MTMGRDDKRDHAKMKYDARLILVAILGVRNYLMSDKHDEVGSKRKCKIKLMGIVFNIIISLCFECLNIPF